MSAIKMWIPLNKPNNIIIIILNILSLLSIFVIVNNKKTSPKYVGLNVIVFFVL